MWKTWWRSPWLPVVAALAPMAVWLYSASVPGGDFSAMLLAVTLWCVLGVLTVVVAVSAVVALPAPRARRLWTLWPLLLVPALAVLSADLTSTGRVDRITFDLHRSALEELVTEVAEKGRVSDRRVGLYSVTSATRGHGCTIISLKDAGQLYASTGYAHCPGARPQDAVGDGYRFEPVDGPWYVATFVW